MQKQPGCKVKTINLDSDIFKPDIVLNNKLAVPLIRSLTQKKKREYRKMREDSHQRFSRNIERQRVAYNEYKFHNQTNINEEAQLFEHFVEDDNNILKRHTKTNPSNHKKEPYAERKSQFKRYNHSHSHSVEAKNEDPQNFFESFHKDSEVNPLVLKQDDKDSPRPEDRMKVNPYTKDQYIYMRNRQIDELMQLKRSAKLTRMNSITKSYRVATINLSPQTNRSRTNSFKIVMPNIPNKGKNTPIINGNAFKNTKKQSEIKPWQWLGPEQSKQYLM